MNACKMSFVVAIAAAAFTVGCATSGDPSSKPMSRSAQTTADAVLYINGLA